MYARYRTRSRFYKEAAKPLRAYNVQPNFFRKPKVKHGLLNGIYSDQTVDLRDKERLELLESIRHPRERDFYQDHTFHNQWVDRDLEKHQKTQVASRYRFFDPNFAAKKWIWYPGDMVEVISGEGQGQRGSIIAVVKYKNEILVQNVNVQDVTIPASETRPEQIVQREHPISIERVRHVDPSTDQLCHIELVTVRNKETGKLEERRISLESGVLLPTPQAEDQVEAGDPLKDTAIQDADEPTYEPEKEIPLLVERRLRAMENYFVESLKEAYEFHRPLQQQNAQDMLQFQMGVVQSAGDKIADHVLRYGLTLEAKKTTKGAASAEEDNMPDWWGQMLAPYVQEVQEEKIIREEEERAAQQRAQEELQSNRSSSSVGGEDEEDIFEEVEENDDDNSKADDNEGGENKN